MNHSALFRNDRGGLEVRHYPTAQDAARVAFHRELPSQSEIEAVAIKGRGTIRHTVFARKLGVSVRVIRRAYDRGELPGAVEHSAYILMIPVHLLRLAEAYGLRGVGRMAKAGML